MNRMLGFFSKKYTKVEQLDEKSDNSINSVWTDTTKGKARSFRTAYLPWLLHFFAISAYSILIFVNHLKRHACSPCFSENLLGAPIVWEDRTFYTNKYVNHTDPYSGENPDVDSVWADPIENIIIVITEEEKKNLPGGRDTARAYGEQNGYAVSIEMFHQLHCLNYLRKSYFSDSHTETFSLAKHADHCFSYLYQTLLCYADVGVATVKLIEEYNVFQPEFNVTKQCRNHSLIKDWQNSRKAQFYPQEKLVLEQR
ncbi:hypothetical protein B0O99DRAFT_677883 [Bisporella sp. PMI_857]|nr:hypothetical protein B0O99DRAFT_677883 [Bisporella sp. PMI_857]